MTYTIKRNEWNYDGRYPCYIDDSHGIMVELYCKQDGVKLLGSSTSYIDNCNLYYYDLTSNSFANRAWNNIYGDYNDIFNNDDEVVIDIDIPNWFIDHAQKMMEFDSDCIYTFEKIFENNNDTYTSDYIYDTINNYIKNNDITNITADDIIYVAEQSGILVYDYPSNEYIVNI